ncbi:Uncharacterised protein [Mannheimia haemolytica]|uniref:Uncharacterized protein n=1 Tax=Mannheimia haemolytica TaxID=75985 RepID=A0A378N3E4_MANHA|nr:Uncharacterised protein [Mannheimia haemolytica]
MRSGEYRYHLLKEGNVYYLNPEKEEEPKITQKGPSETADPLPEYTGDIEHSEKGPVKLLIRYLNTQATLSIQKKDRVKPLSHYLNTMEMHI